MTVRNDLLVIGQFDAIPVTNVTALITRKGDKENNASGLTVPLGSPFPRDSGHAAWRMTAFLHQMPSEMIIRQDAGGIRKLEQGFTFLTAGSAVRTSRLRSL